MRLAPMEQAGSKAFAEGESELEVSGLTSTGHGSAVCLLNRAGKSPNGLPRKPFSESKRTARRAMKRALAKTHRRYVTG